MCQNGDCWCECSVDFPQCNCPLSDLEALENNLLHIVDSQRLANQEFEESGESGIFTVTLQKWDLEMSAGMVLSKNPEVEHWLSKAASESKILGHS